MLPRWSGLSGEDRGDRGLRGRLWSEIERSLRRGGRTMGRCGEPVCNDVSCIDDGCGGDIPS